MATKTDIRELKAEMTVIRGELNLFRWLFGLIIGLNLAILFNLCLPEFERAPHGNMARSRTQ